MKVAGTFPPDLIKKQLLQNLWRSCDQFLLN
jgi:hypothetical protein